MANMRRRTKVGLVLGGYILACLIASGVVAVYQRLTQDAAAAQASAGMYAFGDMILFLSVFGFLMLFPSGLALYFLIRKFQPADQLSPTSLLLPTLHPSQDWTRPVEESCKERTHYGRQIHSA